MSTHWLPHRATGRLRAGRLHVLLSWYGLMGLVGFGFGSLTDRRPFGGDLFVHPLLMLFILLGLGFLALRVLLVRPAPAVISDRSLIVGCVFGFAMFFAGNFFSAQVMPLN